MHMLTYLGSLQCQAYFILLQVCTLQTPHPPSPQFYSFFLVIATCSFLCTSLFLGYAAGCATGKAPQHKDAGDDVKPRNAPLWWFNRKDSPMSCCVGRQGWRWRHLSTTQDVSLRLGRSALRCKCQELSLFLAPGSVLSQMGSATCWVTFWNWVMGLRLR